MFTNITELNTSLGLYPKDCQAYFIEYISGISVKASIEYMIFPIIIIIIYFFILLAIQLKNKISDQNIKTLIEFLERHMPYVHFYILICLIAFMIVNKATHTII